MSPKPGAKALGPHLPASLLSFCGALLAALAGGVLRIRRRHVEASMERAGIEEPRRTASLMYRSLGTGLMELLWMAVHPKALPASPLVIPKASEEAFSSALALGRGVVVATAHTGNWDLAACAVAAWLGSRSVGFSVVTKRLSWRALDRIWQALRKARGVGLINTEGATAAVLAALRRREVVAMMIDQVPERRRGVAIFPFLGADARHDLAPLMLAARAGAPVVVAFARRVGPGEHAVEVVDVIAPTELATKEEVGRAMMRVAGALECFVREHPGQWLWMHRRWKGWGGKGASHLQEEGASHLQDKGASHLQDKGASHLQDKGASHLRR